MEISFCIPSYNGRHYLDQAVESVLKQELTDFEVIIVDDYSTDGSFELARQLAAKDCRIRAYRNEKNLGIVANWNRCLEVAQGEWIKYVFQDDWLAPKCVSKLLSTAVRTGCKFLICEREIQLEDDISWEIRNWFATKALRFCDVFPGRDCVSPKEFCLGMLKHLGNNFIGEPTSALIHRSCFFRHGTFNRRLVQMCDLEFWCRLACYEGVAYVPERLATFRVHSAAATSTNGLTVPKRFQRDVLDYLILFAEFLVNPAFQLLRDASPFSRKCLQETFTASVRGAERYLREMKNSDQAPLLQAIWREALAQNPGIGLLRQPIPVWRRVLNRLSIMGRSLRAGLSASIKKLS